MRGLLTASMAGPSIIGASPGQAEQRTPGGGPEDQEQMTTLTASPPTQRTPRLSNALHEAIALRVYEICITRGYVDRHDWIDVARQLRQEAARRRARRLADRGHTPSY